MVGSRQCERGGMLIALIALAALAGNTVVAAATTDAWEAARRKFAQLLGRGDPDRTKLAELRLDQTRQQLEEVNGQELEKAQASWKRPGRSGLRTCWRRTRAWRPTCAPWWRRSGRSCRLGWYRRLITRSRLGVM